MLTLRGIVSAVIIYAIVIAAGILILNIADVWTHGPNRGNMSGVIICLIGLAFSIAAAIEIARD